MATTGRDGNGRFVKGHKSISPGRPKQKREDRFMAITQSACTFADWRAIVKAAVGQAKKGDAAARRWLGDYLLGPPPQKIEHSAPDGIAITHHFENALKRAYSDDSTGQVSDNGSEGELPGGSDTQLPTG